ncbi:Serine/threonine-protein kinase PknD [Fuerstiella marisgermanici]|uniref:Serine/threonine-protein kinase PknD n=2 Tax=Fuerstiella marisgermanici TaxID=1891926 RepID=A0A1P8WP16_9PLAN|nr:Serine/threonine-protein kinase PknD [Fuerstiella marisgermanici]
MREEAAERDLLIAARAVEQQIITAEDLARAVAHWTGTQQTPLLTCMESELQLSTERRDQLRDLFAQHKDSLSMEIAESIDDSLFGKLNSVLAAHNVDEEVQASVARWKNLPGRMPLMQISEGDRFEIISEHARGGLGEVWLAADLQLNRQVALKRIREKWADNQNAKIRFQLEAEITGRLEHPGVVPVYALGQRGDGQIYYAMRFIRGESLEAAVDSFHKSRGSESMDLRSPELRNLMRRFADACNTISYAHSRGIIHRDLKPANIMLGKYGETLVVDWGLAKQIGTAEVSPGMDADSIILSDSGSGSAPTQFGSAVGTPQYMSPEQAAGQLNRMGPATDVFGLGATLYHVLTNQPPQKQDSVERILERVQQGDSVPPSEINPNVPAPLEQICLKAMALQPSDRYTSPMELGEDVERWMADEPVSVCRDSLAVRTVRWVRKHQTLAATSAVAMLLLTAASVIGSLAWSQFEHQQLVYEQARLERETEANEKERDRLAELDSSLAATQTIVRQQVDEGRFAIAVRVLNSEIDTLAGATAFAEQRAALQAKSRRLQHIAEFYELAAFAERANYLAEDEDEIIAIVKALDLLAVWDHADWWNHLPAEDLNAQQHDRLQQAVYKQLVLLASTYIKLTGMRTLKGVGGKMPDTLTGQLGAIFSKDGKEEARATAVICDMANRFRYAECLRWYHGIAGLRLLKWTPVPSRRLKAPRNSTDAYELAIMLLTRAIIKDFPFAYYRGVKDDLMNARETLSIASEMAPDHYWTHLLLAQTEYLLAERTAENGEPEAWQYYETARQTFGRCVALNPALPFAYTDLSSVTLRQMEVIENSKLLEREDVVRIKKELLQSCVRYAWQAVERAPKEAWVYWHHGHALGAADRQEDAMAAYAKAVQLDHRFGENRNEELIDIDQIRGRSRMIEDITKLIENGEQRSVFAAVLAAGYLSNGDHAKANHWATIACDVNEVHPLAWSTAGLLAMHEKDLQAALSHFRNCRNSDPGSVWATIGMALCYEQLGDFPNAETLFSKGAELATVNHQIAEALLGQCRAQMQLGKSRDAGQALRRAKEVYPACHLDSVTLLATQRGDHLIEDLLDQLQPISTFDIAQNQRVLNTAHVPVQNGGFELPLNRYWHNPGGPAWHLVGEGESAATTGTQQSHGGNRSLHIRTTSLGADSVAGTRQIITVEENATYRISCRAKSNDNHAGGVSIIVAKENSGKPGVAIELPAGKYDWQEVVGEFDAPTSRRFPGLVPVVLSIQSSGIADVWLDDIVIQRVTPADLDAD